MSKTTPTTQPSPTRHTPGRLTLRMTAATGGGTNV